jgi:hypothetical protein
MELENKKILPVARMHKRVYKMVGGGHGEGYVAGFG